MNGVLFLLSTLLIVSCEHSSSRLKYGCATGQLECSDGSCIPALKQCDGAIDCPNGDDEDLVLCKSSCGSSELRCGLSGTCIPLGWKCDGEPDCPNTLLGPDNTDEDLSECKPHVVCPDNKFECLDKRGCITMVEVCNTEPECADGSDEGPFCLDDSACAQTRCEVGCIATPTGPRCVCHSGYVDHNGTCIDDNECEKEGVCDQKCVNIIGSYRCECFHGYNLTAGRRCRGIGESPELIVTFPSQFRVLSLNGSDLRRVEFEMKRVLHMEVLHKNSSVCILTENNNPRSSKRRSIQCFDILRPSDTWFLSDSPQLTLEDVVAVAFDWVGYNWYVVDGTRCAVLVCREKLSVCVPVHTTELREPRGLALDPPADLMFFSVWGASPAVLAKSSLDGTSRSNLVTHKVVHPSAVTVDTVLKHVYWVDTFLDIIDRVGYDGRNRLVIKRIDQIMGLRSISVFEHNLFVTTQNHVFSIDKFDRSINNVITFDSKPQSAVVFQSSSQTQLEVEHPCSKNNGGCEGVCVAAGPKPRCLCPAGSHLVGGACATSNLTASPLFIALTTPPRLHLLSFSNGSSSVLATLLNFHKPVYAEADSVRGVVYVADSHPNSLVLWRVILENITVERVVEIMGTTLSIAVDPEGWNVFHVTAPQASSSLNAYLTVTDLSPPHTSRRLVKTGPTSRLFYDKASNLIYWSVLHGPVLRCWPNGSNVELVWQPDEFSMDLLVDFVVSNSTLHLARGPYIINYPIEKAIQFDAAAKEQNQPEARKVGKPNASHGKLTNYARYRYGLQLLNSSLYFTADDGFYRMPAARWLSGEPELLLRRTTFFAKTDHFWTPYIPLPTHEEIRCGLNKGGCSEICVVTPGGRACVCGDGREVEATESTSCFPIRQSSNGSCPAGHFRCSDNVCIASSRQCDGFPDCSDSLDEFYCSENECQGETDFRCDKQHCIPRDWVCDGQADCVDKSDEAEANCRAPSPSCGPAEFSCNSTRRCIPEAWVCDGRPDCGEDESDESNCYDCGSEFSCSARKGPCIKKNRVCDGIPDCSDGSDESDCLANTCNSEFQWLCEKDGRCLAGSVRCDGYVNCSDGSDEMGCDASNSSGVSTPPPPPRICEPSEFACADNLACIRRQFVCDGRDDCFDRSDELNCPNCTDKGCPRPTPAPPALVCQAPSRLCDNNTVCVKMEDLCDDRRNCKDGSDEGRLCDRQLCQFGHGCSHFCHNAPEGIVCYCPEGLHLKANSSDCMDPCDAWGVCAHTCHVKNNRVKCGCLPGYLLEPDMFSCKSINTSTPLLIFSNRHELRGVDLHTMNFTAKALIFSLKNTIALDFYHGAQDVIYWTDVIDDKIYRGTLIGGSLSNIEVVVQTGLSTAEGLAVDWIGGNLYWVESNLDQIEVAKLNGSFRRTLIAGQMESPRAVALDPRVGLLFWTDWDATFPRIERCSMAGGHRRLVVKVDDITDGAWPNGLTLDYIPQRIYWIDARSDSIHTTTYDGQEHHEVMRGHETLSHPFAIALYDNYVYWTDWRTNSVSRANKWNGTQLSVIQRTLTQPFDIQIMHPSRQPRDAKKPSPCEKNNGGCSHLCLIDIENGFECNCPHIMRLSSDNRTCVAVNERILMFSRSSEIRGVDLEMPYFHTIPTISTPQVIAPCALDFYANRSRLFWADPQSNEVKSSNLQGGPVETLIDTGIVNPTGLSVDWISGNLYVSASGGAGSHISVCNLKGEYMSLVVNASELPHLTSLAVDPVRGRMFWAGVRVDSRAVIFRSSMDGSNQTALATHRDSPLLQNPQSLMFYPPLQMLFWVSGETRSIQYLSVDAAEIVVHTFDLRGHPFALVPYNGHVYYSDHEDLAIHRINLTNAANNTVLRNNTGSLLSMRIYDPQLQNQTSNACTQAAEKCQHLCLPISTTDRRCTCATGFSVDPNNPYKCVGVPELLIYSVNWEVKGIALDLNSEGQAALGPLSRVAMATHLTCVASKELILWADGDQGRVTRIRRDGTERMHVLDRPDTIDAPGDFIAGVAVDWIAENVYWTDPKMNVVEVARLNGTMRYVVVPDGHGRMGAIAVDPIAGFMFWVLNGAASGVMAARLDGSDRRPLLSLPASHTVSDIAVDIDARALYWCSANQKLIGRVNYDGSNQTIALNTTLEYPLALVIHDGHIYWIDTVYLHGSMRKAPVTDLINQTVILQDKRDSLKDIDIFSLKREKGDNPCRTHPCAGLCFFNGSHPVCACPHGRVGRDGLSCVEYTEFLMYSRVTQIDSIHMTDKSNLNAPFPPIEHRDFMRNAIGLTYDYRTAKLFYSDIQRGSINSVFFNGTNHTVLVQRQGSVEGIAYDSFDNALYWTCNNYATISRMYLTRQGRASHLDNSNGSGIETVVKLFRDDKPRGIVVNPCHSQIFWTNWNTHAPSIQRSFINGVSLESIVTTNIKMPNAITLDFQTMKLYWGDARLDKIERCDINGKNRVILSGLSPQHPFDMAVFGDYLFWTDWVLHSVMRANKYTGEEVEYLRRDVPRLMGIVAVNTEIYKCTAQCDIHNGGCQDVCTINDFSGVACSCRTGRIADPKNPTRCIAVKELTKDTNTTLFQCVTGYIIPFQLTCDGIAHCDDGSDEFESYCAQRTCVEGFHQCPRGRCINMTAVCDGVNDCGDMSDEFNCICDTRTHFLCPDNKCITNGFRCDNDPDCADASDEMNCPARNCEEMNKHLFPGAEIVEFINCNYTTACIHPKWVCDDQNDCWDGSDELNCPESTSSEPDMKCRSTQFTCRDSACVPMSWVCDHEADCEDGSDEENCPEIGCLPNQFKCNSSECVPMTWRCDLTPDCADGSDESLPECNKTVCSNAEFRCNSSGRCIPHTWVCDGEEDCSDNSDEARPSCVPQLECVDDEFQCDNGRCIAGRLYCDGDQDCGDGSDEPSSCEQQPRCKADQFQCEPGTCIARAQLCDGNIDCPDSSDESIENCRSRLSCNSSADFLCRNNICIFDNQTCDGSNDCGDFSDETLCNLNECLLGTPCPAPQICIDKKVKYECRCPDGLKADGAKCEDINECEVPGTCSHFCWNTFGSFHCFCPKNFTLRANLRSCKANTSIEPRLIYSNRYYIRELEYRTGETTILFHNLTNAVALDYDWLEQCIYWSDVTNAASAIYRMCHGNSSRQLVHSATLQQPDGIAVDWVGRNLYWCDKGLDTIEVSRLDGRYRKVLISENLMEPRAITLNPFEGALYWTDWGERPYIGKASMNGSNFRIIVNDTLTWPNALTLSYETRELFYADAKEDYIAVSDLEGRNRRIIISRTLDPAASLHHIFSMTVFEDFIFWTDWELKSIVKCRRFGKKECEVIAKLIHRPMDVQVFHPLRQVMPERNPCEKNGNCSTLCLLTEGYNEHVCACPDNFVLGPDGRSCVANCSSGRFVCASTYKCIPFWWKCDTQDDCGDNSDEPVHCHNFTCQPGEYQCGRKCIHPVQICDGIEDCEDHTDEDNCDNFECLASYFKCSKNASQPARCISDADRCNGHQDCPNGEDEKNCQCPQSPLHIPCNDSTACIPSVFLCDSASDCPDGSDEGEFCKTRKCHNPHDFKCNSGQCIPSTWKCDGDLDCQTGEDEPASCADPQEHSCQPTYFKCANFKCIPGRWQCDYTNDCGDNSDEVGCVMRNCSESEFRCDSGKCVPGSAVCDGRFHCSDQSDEMGCNVTCGSDQMACSSPKYCIYKEWKCDGDMDCLDGSDELNCSTACPSHQFTCHNKQCLDKQWVCDGEKDCSDGSDESEAECNKISCPSWRYRCKENKKCIPDTSLCDGRSDCGDGADEKNEVCTREQRCGVNEVRCRISGECISASFACDGIEHCVDGSDELDCDRATLDACLSARNCSTSKKCLVGLCSQKCIEKKNHFSCQCGPGYTLISTSAKPGKKSSGADKTAGKPVQDGYMCTAVGEEPKVVFAADANIHIMGLYSPREIKVINTGASVKTLSIDFYQRDDANTTIFFVDHLKKKIFTILLPKKDWMTAKIKRSAERPENSAESLRLVHVRLRRSAEPVALPVSLLEPRAIAVDWLTQRLYVIDARRSAADRMGHHPVASIVAMTLDGRKKTSIIEGLYYASSELALDPESGLLAYSHRLADGAPLIETATLDGSRKTRLVHQNLVWPTGLAFDTPAARLYFADGKRRTIESVGLNGEKRMLVAQLDRAGPMPFKIDVFEDSVMVSTHQSDKVLRLHKFNYSSSIAEQHVFVRVTDLVVMQSARQMGGPSNPCAADTCHESALCVMGPLVAGQPDGKCLCPVGLYPDEVASRNSSQLVCSMVPIKCSLACKRGKCHMTDTGPKCICEPDYYGDLCHKYNCSGYCQNGGRCMTGVGGMRCYCKAGFSGERCEEAIHCGSPCINGGECKIIGPGAPARCVCPPNFTGTRCENCVNLMCENGGICSQVGGSEGCLCSRGFRGVRCEVSVCQGYCAEGTCSVVGGTPHCTCPPTLTGLKCDRAACQGYCASGATCVINENMQKSCVCPPHRSGPRCEQPTRCGDDFCYNAGICEYAATGPECRCVGGWRGRFCDKHPCTYDFCDNGGTCKIQDNGAARCLCVAGYYGKQCENVGLLDKGSEERVPHIDPGLGVTAGVLIAICIFLFILVSIAAAYFVTARMRRGNAFSHVRMSENVEMNNPMYLRGEELEEADDEQATVASERVATNFGNPVYETMYNAGDEKKNLLSAAIEEPLPLDNDSVEC